MSNFTYGVIDGNTREVLLSGVTEDEMKSWARKYCDNKANPKRMLSFKKELSVDEPKIEIKLKPKDAAIAKFYLIKMDRADVNGHEFTLTFAEFKRLSSARKCRFTGLDLCADTFTIDRIDNSVGYVTGNVAACHKAFNQLKAIVENSNNELSIDNVTRAFVKVNKHINL